jgi:spectinomycin phosphotransferase
VLDKPNIKDETLIACLRERYDVSVATLEFLPLGHDWKAGVYRVCASGGATYLAKVRQETIDEASVAIPHYLKDHGLAQVVAPLHTRTNELWTCVEDYALLLYPFIEGQSGMMAGLTDQQWIEYGAVLRRIHSTPLPDDLLASVPKETFVPNPDIDSVVQELLATIEPRQYADPYQNELAAFWNERRAEIQHLVDRAQALGRALQAAPPEFVLCHADIHTANLLLDADGRLCVIDWDQPIMAPKERDLLFVVDTPIGLLEAKPRQEGLFFKGYGATEVDWLALAYYRYEWAVQDIGGFAELVFLHEDASEETKAEALSISRYLFQPGKIVAAAYAAEQHLPPELQSPLRY